jgi:two-component system chemotaxis response regulator CheB
MRNAVTRLLSGDDRFEVVGQAKDGLEAVAMAASLKPHVMTMDFNMPGLNGAEATRQILAAQSIGIVMLSAHTLEGARETIDALAAGAIDFVTKPGGEVSTNLVEVRDELVQKLVAAAKAKGIGRADETPVPVSKGLRRDETPVPVSKGLGRDETPAPVSKGTRRVLASTPAGLRVVVLAASTGGPAALERVVSAIEKRDDLGVLVVQHMPVGYTTALAERLDRLSKCDVREAKAGDRVQGGLVLVAPGGTHLDVDRTGAIRLSDAPPVHGVKPAADVTLKGAALAFGARAIGVVMTGMGRDGAMGLAAVKSAGGVTLAQDAATSIVYGMPRAAAELGVVDQILPLDEIAAAIDRVTR